MGIRLEALAGGQAGVSSSLRPTASGLWCSAFSCEAGIMGNRKQRAKRRRRGDGESMPEGVAGMDSLRPRVSAGRYGRHRPRAVLLLFRLGLALGLRLGGGLLARSTSTAIARHLRTFQKRIQIVRTVFLSFIGGSPRDTLTLPLTAARSLKPRRARRTQRGRRPQPKDMFSQRHEDTKKRDAQMPLGLCGFVAP